MGEYRRRRGKKTWLTYNLMPSPPPLSAFAFFGMRTSSSSATSQTYLRSATKRGKSERRIQVLGMDGLVQRQGRKGVWFLKVRVSTLLSTKERTKLVFMHQLCGFANGARWWADRCAVRMTEFKRENWTNLRQQHHTHFPCSDERQGELLDSPIGTVVGLHFRQQRSSL